MPLIRNVRDDEVVYSKVIYVLARVTADIKFYSIELAYEGITTISVLSSNQLISVLKSNQSPPP